MTTVRELIEQLQELDPDLPVYTAKDAEGNGYNSVYFAPTVMWAEGEGQGIEVCSEEDFEEMKVDDGYDVSHMFQIVVI